MGLLQACRHDPGGPGISAVVGVQMPAGEEDAVGGASRSGSQSRRQLFANAVIGSRDHDGMAAFGAKRTVRGRMASPASVADDPISDIAKQIFRLRGLPRRSPAAL